MQNFMNTVKYPTLKRSMFDLGHDFKLSCNMGELIPIYNEPALPGDKFYISCESLLRFAPLIAPVMHRMDVMMHYFFVPNRILWPNFEKWITNTKDDVSGLLPAFPSLDFPDDDSGYTRLADYLGIPPAAGNPGAGGTLVVSALPFAACQKIYDDYYRDQNLIEAVFTPLTDGAITGAPAASLKRLRNRSYEHDYFTSSLPFAQKGESVSLPLGVIELDPDIDDPGLWKQAALNPPGLPHLPTGTGAVTSDGGDSHANVNTAGGNIPAQYDPNGSLVVGPTTINDLRTAEALQKWLEKNARGGTRYTEMIKAHTGITSPDARLQRPEYITGTKSPVIISEVLNTTGTDDLPQGNMAGHGISVTNGNYSSYKCYEHGYVIGFMSIMPKPAYQQGLKRDWTKISDPTEWFWGDFQNLGEQATRVDEIYAYSGNDANTFGYLPRYAEYRTAANRVAGDFRSTLNTWHLGRIFASQPVLNQTFIECLPEDNTRIFAVEDPDVQKLYCHVYNKIKAVRLINKFGTPKF